MPPLLVLRGGSHRLNTYHWYILSAYAPVIVVLLVCVVSRLQFCRRFAPTVDGANVFAAVLLFLIYPAVCRHTVDLLKPCNEVHGWMADGPGDAAKFVAVDYSLVCGTAMHGLFRALAWPVGA